MGVTLQFLISLGIPSFIMTVGLTIIQRRLNSAEKKRERDEAARRKREEEKEHHELLMLKCIGASIELGEVTARAVKGAKVNGDLDKALERAAAARKCQHDFLEERGVRHLV